MALNDKYRCSIFSYAEKFQLLYKDIQLVLFDEFFCKVPIGQLNLMCDGTYLYPDKGLDAMLGKMIMIICGNSHPQKLYGEKSYRIMKTRFELK